jgi:hypothetical protein
MKSALNQLTLALFGRVWFCLNEAYVWEWRDQSESFTSSQQASNLRARIAVCLFHAGLCTPNLPPHEP